jgi:hypothetical protein
MRGVLPTGLVTVGLISLQTPMMSASPGYSRATGDNTRSNFTRVSRDRDLSSSDKTRDWTYDGVGPKKRDWSGGRTNDNSRNDSRW